MQQNLAQVLQNMGRDVAIPGVELAINLLQELLTDLKGGSSARDFIEAEAQIVIAPNKRLGRPPGRKNKRASGWPSDPEERKKEMARRIAVSQGKAKSARVSHGVTSNGKVNRNGLPQKMHPRDPRHPDHDAYIAKLKKSQRRFWNSLSPTDRKTRVDTMLQHRSGKNEAAA